MSMIDPYEAARLEQSRRRAIRLLSIVMLFAAGFCAYMVFGILTPRGQSRDLGSVNEFKVGETVMRPVRKLTVSDTIQNRPLASEDPLYITRRADGSWQALLAWDSLSGCIVQPQAGAFVDSCSGHVYDLDGYVIGEQRRLRLGSLPVEISDGRVLVRDSLLRAER
jgi:hypothetical protein